MISEPFAAGNSVIHRIDPRNRIICAAAYSIVVAVAHQVATLLCAFGVACILICFARLSAKDLLKRLGVVAGFLLLVWLVMPVTYEGESIGRVAGFTVTRPGVSLSARITLKSISIVLTLMALIATIQLATLGHALERLRIPSKIVYLFMMTYRYIFVIEKEYHRLLRAAKMRGFRPGTNVHTYKTYAYFIGILFIRAVERADRVSHAMKCRGFSGRFFCLTVYPDHPRNWIFGLVMAAGASALIFFEWIYMA